MMVVVRTWRCVRLDGVRTNGPFTAPAKVLVFSQLLLLLLILYSREVNCCTLYSALCCVSLVCFAVSCARLSVLAA